MKSDLQRRDRRGGFAIFRLTMKINICPHGATQIVGGAGGFAATTSRSFGWSYLPGQLIWGFLAGLPFVEAAIGMAQLLGWRTRLALRSDALLMSVIVCGTTLRSDWPSLGTQMMDLLGRSPTLATTLTLWTLGWRGVARPPQPEALDQRRGCPARLDPLGAASRTRASRTGEATVTTNPPVEAGLAKTEHQS